MIKQDGRLFLLQTDNTSYFLRVTSEGLLEHLYYGVSLGDISEEEAESLSERHSYELGNAVVFSEESPTVMAEDMQLEISGPGKGDTRELSCELVFEDGSRTVDFRFESAEIHQGCYETGELPRAYDDTGTAMSLVITMRERSKAVTASLIYEVYPECDVITKSCILKNDAEEKVTIERLMSSVLDIPRHDLILRSFHGAWAREMHAIDAKISGGKHVISSQAGVSSSRANPFTMLHKSGTTENYGLCYGFNLIYSSNHYSSFEVSPYGKTRVVTGINPQGFSWILKPGDSFCTPQAVLTVTGKGFSGMSRAMHSFIREHIVRGSWKRRERPVLLNSWESFYFKYDEKKLLKLASKAKDAGIELFVLDDGWFSQRNSDKTSLGDWDCNLKKLPGGLPGLCNKINDMGLDFGIWVEPEMISTDSNLYRAHPEWAMDIPGREHSEGRNQRILDLCNPEVERYITDEMSKLFASANIKYVKWDMNRIFSDVFSKSLAPEQQGEVAHRYVTALYRIMKTLTERFPEVLFEGCASGGNRFDLGILSYFPQIWASDNTDPVDRALIQESYSYGYPASVISNHVSDSPNHQTLRVTPIDTRYSVACFGLLGYELNLLDISEEDMKSVKDQIKWYKEWRSVLQFGDLYRRKREASHTSSAMRIWTSVSKDKTQAVGMIMQELVTANSQAAIYKASGLDPSMRYHVYNNPHTEDIRQFGALINTQSPVHIRPGSMTHRIIARRMSMPGETEEHTVPGSLLMRIGIKLTPAFSGTGYDENVRYFQDFASRLYYIEAIDENER